jgi:3-hydroxymyristoyl/3-hydroxydecanoyl-(acyl carrier protein) dehydratase
MTARTEGAASFRIGSDHPSLPGHFPGRPLVPGVLILDEVVAAIAAVTGESIRIVRMPQIKFVAPLQPDEQADVEWQRQADSIRFSVRRGAQMIASGELVVSLA